MWGVGADEKRKLNERVINEHPLYPNKDQLIAFLLKCDYLEVYSVQVYSPTLVTL